MTYINISDPTTLTYLCPFPIDYRLSVFINGIIMNEGDEYVLGPGAGEITLTFVPSVGDRLDFRKV